MSSVASHTLPLTERIAGALRDDDITRVRQQAPLVASLLDLLNALGYGDCRRDVIEAMPHYEDVIDLPELRKMLLSFGLSTDTCITSLGRIDVQHLPCLFVPRGERLPWIVLGREADEVRYCDPLSGLEGRASIATRGSAWLLTETGPSTADDSGDWFGDLLWRFRGLLKHLLAMTLFTNLVGIASPLFLMAVYDKVVGPHDTASLPLLTAGMAFILIVDFAMRVLKTRTLSLVAGRLDYLISTEVFAKIIALPPTHTERAAPDAQLAQIRQFEGVREFVTGASATALLDAPFLLLHLFTIALIGGAIVWVPIGAGLVFVLTGAALLQLVQRRTAQAGITRSERQHHFMKSLAGLHEIKARCAEPMMQDRFRIASAASAAATAKLQSANAFVDVAAQTISTIAAVLVVLLGVAQVLQGDLTTGGLVACIALTWRALTPLNALLTTLLKSRQMLRSIKSLNRLMQLRSERSERTPLRTLSAMQGAVSFERVLFRYAANSDPVLIGLSLQAMPGEFLAIMGANSSGKSTLFKLI
jgi:ATP-binding cassette, subfamily C, bacterial LapB